MTITGTGWATIIRNKFSDLLVAVAGDVAQWLSLMGQQAWLRSSTAGTNSVSFVVTINDPSRTTAQLQAKWEEALTAGGRTWMPRTNNLYVAHSGQSDNPALGAAGAEAKPENICTTYMPSMEDTDECNGMIAGIVIAVVVLLGLLGYTIWQCCCKYVPPPQDSSVKYAATAPK